MRNVLFVDVAIQPEVRFIAKQNSLMKIGNNGNLVLGPFDESTPCLMIVLMNCQTKLRINHLTAVKSVAILEKKALTPMCAVRHSSAYAGPSRTKDWGCSRRVWFCSMITRVHTSPEFDK
ncbi:alpha-2 adrenergic receptor [Trichonephila clavipes]|nr:alpha-2 adrenergic receptor [Trichonephila clavipes]